MILLCFGNNNIIENQIGIDLEAIPTGDIS